MLVNFIIWLKQRFFCKHFGAHNVKSYRVEDENLYLIYYCKSCGLGLAQAHSLNTLKKWVSYFYEDKK
jgi:transcription elongation factor Elf1